MGRETSKLSRGDLLNIVVKLRELMAAFDSARFAVDGSFESLSSELEVEAQTLRKKTKDGADATYFFLGRLERHPEVAKLRRTKLQERERRKR